MPLEGRKLELVLEAFGSFFVTYIWATGVTNMGTALGFVSNYVANGLALAGLVYLSNQAGCATCFNPAITFCRFLYGQVGEGNKDWKTLLLYWGVQFGAAFPAAIFGYTTRPDDKIIGCVAKAPYFNIAESFMNEFLWSIAFCYVFLVVFWEEELKNNSVYGLIVGFMYMVMGCSAPISGGGYNPALSLGLWLSSSVFKYSGNDCFVNGFGYLWYFLLAPIAGATVAWLLHKTLHDDRFKKFHKYIMEFVGTFFITLTCCMTIILGSAFDVGSVIAIFTYVGMYKQSGFYNPVYTIMAFVNGGLDLKDFGIFSGIQCAASFGAAVVAYTITRYGSGDGQDFIKAGGSDLTPYRPRTNHNMNKFGALLAEFFATFFVAVMYMAVTSRVHKTGRNNNPFYGLVNGWSVSAVAFGVGSYTYSYFNPAIWFGTAFVYLFAEGGEGFGQFYIYLISDFGGAVAASFFYKYLIGNPYEGPAFDSDEGKSVRERENMRQAAQLHRGKSQASSNTLAVAGGGAGGSDGKGKSSTTRNPSAPPAAPSNAV